MATPLEADVGITNFVSAVPGFHGILKHRFRDFIVREVDLKGEVARLTSITYEEPVLKATNGIGGSAPKGSGGHPKQLATTRPEVVASFSALAGPENGSLLDDLLRRVMEMYGVKEAGLQGVGESTHCSANAVQAQADGPPPVGTLVPGEVPAALIASGEVAAAPGGSSAGDDSSGHPDVVIGGGSNGNGGGEGGYETATATATATATDGSNRRQPERVSVLLLPISSKEVRKAVHEFFRKTPGMPRMRTEGIVTTQQQPQQQEQQQEAHGSKRGPPEGAGEGRPAKWQKDSGRGGGRGGWGGSRGERGSGRGGEPRLQRQSQPTDQTQAQTHHRIEVTFYPTEPMDENGLSDRERECEGGRGGRGGRSNRRRLVDWEGGEHPFARFVLYKENMDTQVALNIVGRHLGMNTSGRSFGFAGTKDKRGVTCQFVTAFKVSPTRLSALNFRLRGIRLGDFTFCNEALRLGSLSGNEFQLLMRDVRIAAPPAPLQAPGTATTATDPQALETASVVTDMATGSSKGMEAGTDVIAQVTAACEAVARTGFINYFGLQRFGTGGAPTQEVGRALLRGEYDKAVRLVLTGRPDERKEFAEARRLFFDQGDAKGALRGLPHFMVNERAVLTVLTKQPNAWAAAMLAVPRTMRMMYLHAWQSYVWNSAASHRIRTYGHDLVVAGDLVLPRSAVLTAAGGDGSSMLMEGDDTAGGGGGGGEMPEDASEGAGGGSGSAARRLALVRLVTDADVDAGRYDMFDVVLPLPGTEVQYPMHETGSWIRKAANEAGVDLESVGRSSAANRDLSFASLTGDYRYVLHRPKDFYFALKRYTDPHDDTLVLSDQDLLGTGQCRRGSEAVKQHQPEAESELEPSRKTAAVLETQEQLEGRQEPAGGEAGSGAEAKNAEGGGVSCRRQQQQQQGNAGLQYISGSGPLLALELRFQLPPSCYATMLLRELMKTSTSRSFHMGLSAAVTASDPLAADEGAEDGPIITAAAAATAAAADTTADTAEDLME